MRRFVGIVVALAVMAAFGAVDGAQAGTSWPGFRGPDHSGTVDARLLSEGSAGLTVGWKKALGSGYSSVVVGDGRVVVMFADGEKDAVGAFDIATGEEQWRYPIGETYAGHDGSHDGPISTPLLAGDRVFGFSAWGHLFSVESASGKEVWTKNLVEELGAQKPHYGFTSSPILVEGVLVLEIGAPEGKAIAGFDPRDGNVLWTVGDDGIQYQSPIAAEIGGRTMVLAVGNEKLFGIDPASGEVSWSYEHGGDGGGMGSASLVPVAAGEGRFFVMNKTDSSAMLGIEPDAEKGYVVKELWSNNALRSSYVTPVYHDGHLYGISGRVLTCVDAETGERRWRSREPGDGFVTMVGDQLVVMTKPGSLHVVAATPEAYRELAAIELFEEHSWSEVAFAGGHLFARSMNELARIDVASSTGSGHSGHGWVSGTEFGAFLAEVENAADKNAVVDAYFRKQSEFPIVEGPDVAHFVIRSESDDVGIVGDLLGFRREDPMNRIDGTDLFYYSARLEPDAAVTYGFIDNYEDEPTADPLNSREAEGLFGEVSLLTMPAWTPPAFIAEADASRRGRVEELVLDREWTVDVPVGEGEGEDGGEGGEPETKTETKTEKRPLHVYLPSGFDASADRSYPTLYVLAGKGALEDGQMKNALDNLIGDRVQPLIAVFVMPYEGQEDDRIGPRGAYLDMVVKEVVPFIDGRFPTIEDARARAVIGGGGAGAAALVAAMQNPETFGRVGSHSAVLFSTPIDSLLSSAGERPISIYMDWGTYDLRSPHEAWDMVEENRKWWSALRGAGYRPAGGEAPEGFGWACWRGHTDELLTSLFPMSRPVSATTTARLMKD